MAAQYKVRLVRKEGGRVVETEFLYVSASDDKAGYRKAARRAEARLVKAGRKGFQAAAAECVG